MSIQSALLCVGSELLRGKINTHTATLSQRFSSLGIDLAHEETIPDELEELTDAIRRNLERFSLVIVTGGLGPTFDDLSREAAAAATGHALKRSSKILRQLNAKFRKAGYNTMPPMNARQADVLQGATVIANAFGTAPGQWLELPVERVESRVKRNPTRSTPHPPRVLVLIPGPPRELKPMLEDVVLPRLRHRFRGRPRAEAHLHFVGIGESLADQKIRPIIKRYEKRKDIQVRFTILAHLGLVDFDVFVEAKHERTAQRWVAKITGAIQHRLKPFCYGLDAEYPLAKVVGNALRQTGATLSVAESCTGGLLAAQLTDIPGSSDYFSGGLVAYANRIKVAPLGVSQDLLTRYGAVSREVAAQMAIQVRERFKTSIGISITGVAGPGGATPKKPVGLVYISIATVQGSKTQDYHFTGARDVVRMRAVTAALDLLRQELLVKKKRFR